MEKYVKDSYTEQVQILTQSHMNGFGRLFGGQLMKWIDIVAAVVARRHSECNVTTVLVEGLEFKKPARANDTLVLKGHITYAGKTSMEVKVNTYIEKLNGEKLLINTAFVVLVALDENDKPTTVPKLILTNEKEEKDFSDALLRKEQRMLTNSK